MPAHANTQSITENTQGCLSRLELATVLEPATDTMPSLMLAQTSAPSTAQLFQCEIAIEELHILSQTLPP